MTDNLPTKLDVRVEGLRPDDVPFLDIDEGGEQREWRVESMDAAAWASRKIAEANQSIQELEAWAEREKARIEAVLAREKKPHEHTVDFFTAHLGDYLRRLLAAGRTRKSLELPGGVVKLTARKPKLDVGVDAFIAWAQRSGRLDLLRVKHEVNMKNLQAAVHLATDGIVVLDGEVVEGVRWEGQEDSVSFQIAQP